MFVLYMSLSFINYPDFEGTPIAVVNNTDKKSKKTKDPVYVHA